MSLIDANDLTDEQLNRIVSLVKSSAGINLDQGKQALVRARLAKRLRELGMASYREYVEYLTRRDSVDEFTTLLDVLSTNVTSFFREPAHFELLRENVLPELTERAGAGSRRVRIWSAGCSTGEEPYSIAVVLREVLPDIDAWDAKILATDLSTRALERAKDGVFDAGRLEAVPPAVRYRYFTRSGDREGGWRVKECLRSLVHFARLNLMGRWPMRGPFDVIFCRNVMIYFDKPTQERLVQRFHGLLRPAGYFFIGHSESLTGVTHRFRYLQPSAYVKP
ncbi:MAG: protein-glutamate O-methyltransferase [Planctomycetota bacterium]